MWNGPDNLLFVFDLRQIRFTILFGEKYKTYKNTRNFTLSYYLNQYYFQAKLPDFPHIAPYSLIRWNASTILSLPPSCNFKSAHNFRNSPIISEINCYILCSMSLDNMLHLSHSTLILPVKSSLNDWREALQSFTNQVIVGIIIIFRILM